VTIYACTVTSESATVPVITPGTHDGTTKQIAELQRQVTILTAMMNRQERRWEMLGKAAMQ
jgi:hypothetical protein